MAEIGVGIETAPARKIPGQVCAERWLLRRLIEGWIVDPRLCGGSISLNSAGAVGFR